MVFANSSVSCWVITSILLSVEHRQSATCSSMSNCCQVINEAGANDNTVDWSVVELLVVQGVDGCDCIMVLVESCCWSDCIIVDCSTGGSWLVICCKCGRRYGDVRHVLFGSIAAHASSALISSWQLIILHWMALRSTAGCSIGFRDFLVASVGVSWMVLVLLNIAFVSWEGICT